MKYLSLTFPGLDGSPAKINPTDVPVPVGGLESKGTTIISLGITLLLIFAILLALGYLIWGGVDWITSGGDKHNLQNAKRKIIFAIVGLVVATLSFLFINIITYIFTGQQAFVPRP